MQHHWNKRTHEQVTLKLIKKEIQIQSLKLYQQICWVHTYIPLWNLWNYIIGGILKYKRSNMSHLKAKKTNTSSSRLDTASISKRSTKAVCVIATEAASCVQVMPVCHGPAIKDLIIHLHPKPMSKGFPVLSHHILKVRLGEEVIICWD